MPLLNLYLAKKFFIQSFALYFVALFLIWLTQLLRLFDLVSAKGQDFFTLIGQSVITTPRLAVEILFVCLGIGLARTLYAMQQTRELHSIYSLKIARSLWMGLALFILLGIVFISFMAHFVNPWSQDYYAKWNEEIAADIIGRALNPNQFSEVSPGLVVVIGGRTNDGLIKDFFANDRREENNQRTFIAKRAQLTFDDEGYDISLIDGTVQFMRENEQFTQIGFNRYEISLDRPSKNNPAQRLSETDSMAIIKKGLNDGKFSKAMIFELNNRFSEALRILALCLFIFAIAAYPNAKRGRRFFPIEATVVLIGLGEKALSSLLIRFLGASPFTSSLILLLIAILIILVRHIRPLPKIKGALA